MSIIDLHIHLHIQILLSAAFEADVPAALRIKLFINPPAESGNFSLKQKRLWHFSPKGIDQTSLVSTLKEFQRYFDTTNCLEVSYFDGEEEMLFLKDEDLKEACRYFVLCYQQYENYQAFMKIYLTEKLQQNAHSRIIKLPEADIRPFEGLYKKLTATPSRRVVSETTVTSSNDEKLEHMKVKITKEYNVEDVQAEVIDKSSIKCASCKVVVKLGKPYNIHNFKKHRQRCQKVHSKGTQSISTLFLAMTAVAEEVRSKSEAIIVECQKLKDEGFVLDTLLKALQKVAEKPCSLDAVAADIQGLCLEAVATKTHPLFLCFIDLCDAGRVTVDSEPEVDESNVNSEYDEDDASEEGSVL